ncbi:hypothetical protein [Brevibacillus choshinensis]|nr:hypothetical protein [Brevibacillus choshinensis]
MMYTVFAMVEALVKAPRLLGDLHVTGSVCPFFGMQISYRKQVPEAFAL